MPCEGRSLLQEWQNWWIARQKHKNRLGVGDLINPKPTPVKNLRPFADFVSLVAFCSKKPPDGFPIGTEGNEDNEGRNSTSFARSKLRFRNELKQSRLCVTNSFAGTHALVVPGLPAERLMEPLHHVLLELNIPAL